MARGQFHLGRNAGELKKEQKIDRNILLGGERRTLPQNGIHRPYKSRVLATYLKGGTRTI